MLIIELFKITTPAGDTFYGQRYNRHFPDGKDFYDVALNKWLNNRHVTLGECIYETLEHYKYSYENRDIVIKKLAEIRNSEKNVKESSEQEVKQDSVVTQRVIKTAPRPEEIERYLEPVPGEEQKDVPVKKKRKAKELSPEAAAEKAAKRYEVMLKIKVDQAKAVVLSLIDQGLQVNQENYNANKPNGRGYFGWSDSDFAKSVMDVVFKELGLGSINDVDQGSSEQTEENQPKNG